MSTNPTPKNAATAEAVAAAEEILKYGFENTIMDDAAIIDRHFAPILANCRNAIEGCNAWIAEAKPLLERGGEAERKLTALTARNAELEAESEKDAAIITAHTSALTQGKETEDDLRNIIVGLDSKLSTLTAQLEAASRKQPINTHVRLFDLVRQQRAELHDDGLITSEEYAWLSGGAGMAVSDKGGSPSPRRLEDYDDMRKQLEAAKGAVLPLDDDVKHVLGFLAMDCRPYAEMLRADGVDIPRKIELEQATVLHWMLGYYLKFGAKWRAEAGKYVKAHIEAQSACAAAGLTDQGGKKG